MKTLQTHLEAIDKSLSVYSDTQTSALKASKRFLFADTDLKKLQEHHTQLHKAQTHMTSDMGVLSLLLIGAFFKGGAGSNSLSMAAVVDVLQRDHPSILAREDNKEVKNSLAVYVPLMFGLRKPPLTEGEKRYELNELMKQIVLGGQQGASGSDASESTAVTATPPHSVSPRVVLLQGTAGTGKSLFGWRIMQFFDELDNTAKKQARIPIVINLPLYKTAVLKVIQAIDRGEEYDGDFLLERMMQPYNLEADVLQAKLKEGLDALRTFRQGHFIFILDGVDELGMYAPDVSRPEVTTPVPVGRLYSLDKWPNSVFVVTSRTDFFKDDYYMLEHCGPLGPDGMTLLPIAEDSQAVKQIHLLPFDEKQRKQYIDSFAVAYSDVYEGWSASRFCKALAQNGHVEELLTDPLMLFMVLNVLPLLEGGDGKATGEAEMSRRSLRLNPITLDVEHVEGYVFPAFTRAEIYSLFTYSWLARELKKKGKLRSAQAHANSEFLLDVTLFCREMAFYMFTAKVTQVSIVSQDDLDILQSSKYKTSSTYKAAKKRVDSADKSVMEMLSKPEGDLAFRCSPLKRSGNTYSFLHKTVQEFFTALPYT